jgi:Ferredoxin-dependent bilin reductase
MLRAVPSLLLVLCCGFQSTRSFVFPANNQGQSRQLELQLQQGGFAAEDPNAEHQAAGLYRPFVEHAWKKLGPLLSPVELRPEFHTKSAIAKGMPEGTVVKITVGAMQGSGKDTNIKYARYALLETLLPGLAETTSGIQVLNLVIFPTGTLPVWGVDLVSLPGDKHLLAMDVQPMSSSSDAIPNSDTFKAWHRKHVEDTFEWGGDLPEAAAKYFSPFCLWTRLNGPKGVYQVQTQVMKAFEEHLDMYLEMMASPQVSTSSSDQEISNQGEYLDYRLANDPARPMLKSLYGPEWTERLLTEVLFPK